MSHELEMIDGKAQMAYAGATPWHGLGKKVAADLTPAQMCTEAGLDWSVGKVPSVYTWKDPQGNAITKSTGRDSLIRLSDGQHLSQVGPDWNPVQNATAADFFHEFVMQGDMEMHTAGSIKNGQIVWFLAKTKNGFDLFKGKDQIDQYILFSNFHKFGFSTDIRNTDIRVVCNNTFSAAHTKDSETQVKIHHRMNINVDKVKSILAKSSARLDAYREQAEFLASKRYDKTLLDQFFDQVFPQMSKTEKGKQFYSRGATAAFEAMENQPGNELGEGTWWQAFNAVTYVADHKLGNKADTRLQSAWYGPNRSKKTDAMDLALEMAKA